MRLGTRQRTTLGAGALAVAGISFCSVSRAETAAERDAHQRELEANYRRNELGPAVSLRRARVTSSSKEEAVWGGYGGVDFLIPLADGPSPLWDLGVGLEVYPLETGTLVTLPVSFAYGFRTPTFMAYGGGIFGAAFPFGDGRSEGGYLFGALAALGVDFGRAHLLLDGRWEHGFFSAGRSVTVLSVGPALGFAF